jgi:hypothetical protein
VYLLYFCTVLTTHYRLGYVRLSDCLPSVVFTTHTLLEEPLSRPSQVTLYDPGRAECHICPDGTEYSPRSVTAFWGGPSVRSRPSSASRSPRRRPRSASSGREEGGGDEEWLQKLEALKATTGAAARGEGAAARRRHQAGGEDGPEASQAAVIIVHKIK